MYQSQCGTWSGIAWPSNGNVLCRLFFFFSSRRRHTRFDCDWSSDVCSSDLQYGKMASSPAVDGRTLVYHSMDGHVYVLDRGTGRLLRQYAFGSPIESSPIVHRSEEHTSELQSQANLVCRLLLEKKKTHIVITTTAPTTHFHPGANRAIASLQNSFPLLHSFSFPTVHHSHFRSQP